MKKFLLGTVAALVLAGSALGAGVWSTYPNAYGTGSSTLTGNETGLFDTNANGQQALYESVLISVNQIRASNVAYLSYTSGNITAAAGVSEYWVTAGGTITSTTVTLPPNPVDGQRFRFFSNVAVTTLTVASGAGATLDTTYAAPTSMTANTSWQYIYIAAQSKWFRFS